jgi:beta-galactosidase
MTKKLISLFVLLLTFVQLQAVERTKLNFNGGWLLRVGDINTAQNADFQDADWQKVTLPRAFNEAEAFKVTISQLTDTVMWYRKHFDVQQVGDRKYFIEFEGVRFGADFWLNGHHLGVSENGVMACGFDLTPYIRQGENVIAVRVDNSWNYKEKATGQPFQWNNKNFNANYGGIPKNVYLHVSDLLYQTLPLYSNLGTTGTYIYGTDYDIPHHQLMVNAESQVRNDDSKARSFRFFAKVLDADGHEVGHYDGERYTLQPGETRTVKVQGLLRDAHFWSWGYGYLYTVKTLLKADDGSKIDDVLTRTGFRKTKFGDGKFWLNDRAMMIHGYAQRTSNEWPGVGMSVPAWLSDYSNGLMVESGGNTVRWMHVTPWKQDVESCDRMGLMEAMPAGDAEHDIEGRQWEQRVALMRDAIIYNKNNPSIIFYESGNESVSRDHVVEMKKLRDLYDPYGGRAVGSREMLDIDESEYGGEMLYVNKSGKHPMWCMEYNRDEGLRKYWDDESYPYHKEGDGPLYRNKPALEYNHNMDSLAVSMVRRWHEYFIDRPGTGRRVNCGGVKIVFSDTNTHHRGESNYRTSGVTDAMRIPKDAFFVHQVMWNGWVTPEKDATYIIGHWNYRPGTVKPYEYVVSTGDEVELFLNGKSLGKGERSDEYLFTFRNVKFAPGRLEAVAYRKGKECSRYELETAGEPDHLVLTAIQNPQGFKADGADMALVQVEVADKQGRRCPLDNRTVNFSLQGEAEWLGGIATANAEMQQQLKAHPEQVFDNYIRSKSLPVECGVNRVLLRSTVTPGDAVLTVTAAGMAPATIALRSSAVDAQHYLPALTLKGNLNRGETPATPSMRELKRTIGIVSIKAGSHEAEAAKSCDDNELSEWQSDGKMENAWITYQLQEKVAVDEITVKLTGWRDKMYPLEIYAGKRLLWKGYTYPTLGYVHIPIAHPVKSDEITIRMVGDIKAVSESGDTAELAGGKAGELDQIRATKGKINLRIVEIDFLKNR